MATAATPIPFTPVTLADRWSCKPGAIYAMIKAGELDHFKVGGKLIRIPASVVAAHEAQTQSRSR